MEYSDSEIRAAVFRAGDLYDRQWSLVQDLEPQLGLSANAMQKRYARMTNWEPSEGELDAVPLNIEEDPEGTLERITEIVETVTSTAHVPDFLDSYAARYDEDDGDWDVEGAEDMRDYSLIDGKFIFSINDRLLTVDFDTWNSICFDYSEHGNGRTQAQVAREYGIPKPMLNRALSKYGQYKASAPACRETIAEHKDDLEPLIDNTVERLELKFLHGLQDKRDRQVRRDYIKLLRERASHGRMVENAAIMLDGVGRAEPRDMPSNHDSPTSFEAHVPTTDEHIGKEVWAVESFGENYDTKISCERLKRHADASADIIRSHGVRCTKVYRTFIGDLFHALIGKTIHETKLDQDTRGAKVWAQAFEACTYSVDRMLEVSDEVWVGGAKGNHDGFDFWQFMFLLNVYYENEERVTVPTSPGHFGYFRTGESVHVIDHGYGVGSLTGWKAKAQAESVAREVAGDDFHGANYLYTYVGHKHELEVSMQGAHHTLMRLESLGESDDYETSLRYPSRPSAHVFILDDRGRPVTDHRIFEDVLRG